MARQRATRHPGRSGASTPCTATTTSSARPCSRTTSAWAPRTTRAWSATIGGGDRASRSARPGQDWAFAPTLAVVRDDRWGRTYEGFSEDPRITRAYGYEAITRPAGRSRQGIGEDGVIATAKHFIGDGGTDGGKDQGVNPSSEAEMINIHGQGYYGALAAGAQTVMVSFNSWTNEEPGSTRASCTAATRRSPRSSRARWASTAWSCPTGTASARSPAAPTPAARRRSTPASTSSWCPADWKAFIANTIAQVEAGEIPMARIDDAVTRILRVKLRAGVVRAAEAVASARYAGSSRRAAGHAAGPRRGARVAGAAKNNGQRAAAGAERRRCWWSARAPTACRTRPAAGR